MIGIASTSPQIPHTHPQNKSADEDGDRVQLARAAREPRRQEVAFDECDD